MPLYMLMVTVHFKLMMKLWNNHLIIIQKKSLGQYFLNVDTKLNFEEFLKYKISK